MKKADSFEPAYESPRRPLAITSRDAKYWSPSKASLASAHVLSRTHRKRCSMPPRNCFCRKRRH